MKYLSVCAGIEAATVAWHPLGWEPVAFSEIDKFPSSVLAHHYPDVPNYGDMTDHEKWPEADIDVLVGGTPCQSFSVAGLRQGMADPRGNLALVYLAIAEQFRPRWLVWENVPGVLSSNGGRDFGAIIGGMVELGYSPCWRVLDAQYHGVAQRRRRVFVVASSRDWRDSAQVLFEPESLRGNPAPSRQSRERTTGDIAHSLRGSGFDASEDGTGRGTPLVTPEIYPTLDADEAVKWGNNQWVDSGKPILCPEVANPLTARMHKGINTTADEGQTAIPVAFNWQNGGGYGDANEGLGITEDGVGPLSRSQVQAIAYGIDEEQNATEDFFGTLKAREKGGGFEGAVAFKTGNSAKARSLGESEHVSPTLGSDAGGNTVPAVAFAQNQRDEVRLMDKAGALAAEPGAKQQTYLLHGGSKRKDRPDGGFYVEESDVAKPLDIAGVNPTANQGGVAIANTAVRRLTPLECCRLQGFPDDYFDNVPGRSDSAVYKALGNSMAVPVMHWIGKRIQKVHNERS